MDLKIFTEKSSIDFTEREDINNESTKLQDEQGN